MFGVVLDPPLRRLRPCWAAAVLAAGLAGCAAPGRISQDAPELKLASIELANGAPEAALRTAQEVVRAAPHDALAWIVAGDAQAALGQAELAEASYRRALGEDAQSIPARLGLLRLRLATHPADAGTGLRRLADQYPHDARIRTDLGVALDLQSRPAEAQTMYREALAIDPALISAQTDLGLSLALSGHAQQGTALLAPLAAGPDSTPKIRQDYAFAATLAGQPEAARAAIGKDLPPEQVASTLDRFGVARDAAR